MSGDHFSLKVDDGPPPCLISYQISLPRAVLLREREGRSRRAEVGLAQDALDAVHGFGLITRAGHPGVVVREEEHLKERTFLMDACSGCPELRESRCYIHDSPGWKQFNFSFLNNVGVACG